MPDKRVYDKVMAYDDIRLAIERYNAAEGDIADGDLLDAITMCVNDVGKPLKEIFQKHLH